MYRRILVPTDGSPAAIRAVEHAFALAREYGATIHALYVVDDSSGGVGLMGADQPSALEVRREEGQKALGEIEEREEAGDVEVVTAVRQGVPEAAIRAYADEVDADLLVMCSHGRSGVSRFLYGSVTEDVVRKGDRPVLVLARQ
jgi:nucleotide-binding universal stress UspA family protein